MLALRAVEETASVDAADRRAYVGVNGCRGQRVIAAVALDRDEKVRMAVARDVGRTDRGRAEGERRALEECVRCPASRAHRHMVGMPDRQGVAHVGGGGRHHMAAPVRPANDYLWNR